MSFKSFTLRIERVQPGCTVAAGASLTPPGDSVVIGRSSEVDVVLDDVSISRRHAELRSLAEGFAVRSLARHGTTFVNSRPLGPDEELVIATPSAWVQIGRVLLRVSVAPETLPVYEPIPLPSDAAVVDAPRVVIQAGRTPRVWIGGIAVPIFPSAARVLARLCESPGRFVPHDTLLDAVDPEHASRAGGANIAQLVTYVRDAFAEAIAQGGLAEPELRALVLAADRDASEELTAGADRRALLRALIPSRRGLGYSLRLPAHAVAFI